MGRIISQITEVSTAEIEAGGFSWRVRKVASTDMARVGHASLIVAQAFKGIEDAPTNGKGASARKGKKTAPEDDSELPTDLFERLTPTALQNMAELKQAVIMAGTVAVGHEDEWEDVEIVADVVAEDAENGVIWIGSLPPGVEDRLFETILSLSTDEGAAVNRLAAFRSAAGSAPAPRPSRAKVRKAAK